MALRSAQTTGGRGPLNSSDVISKMPDDVLVMTLSRLFVKDAVVTSSLSKRWKHLWRNLFQLEFDDSISFYKAALANDEILCDIVRSKFISQVNNVISSHNRPTIQLFRICFDLDCSHSIYINKWIQFAVNKKVESLELVLNDIGPGTRDPDENYDVMFPSLRPMSLTLKNLVLNGVNINEPTLNEILRNSPHLEALSMFGSGLFPHILIGGRINLKKIEFIACLGIETILLCGFDLESFQLCGCDEVEYHLADLPKLKKLDIGQVSVGPENNVFRQISSCAPYLEVLSLEMWTPQTGLDVNAIVKLPNLKKLMLVMGAIEDDCLLEFTAIARACPRLETFAISLLWYSPIQSGRKVRRVVAPEAHKHLKLLEINGYYGRISDLEFVVYAIDNAVALEKIVIDPCCQAYGEDLTPQDCLKRDPVARSIAKRQVTPLLPPGVELTVL